MKRSLQKQTDTTFVNSFCVCVYSSTLSLYLFPHIRRPCSYAVVSHGSRCRRHHHHQNALYTSKHTHISYKCVNRIQIYTKKNNSTRPHNVLNSICTYTYFSILYYTCMYNMLPLVVRSLVLESAEMRCAAAAAVVVVNGQHMYMYAFMYIHTFTIHDTEIAHVVCSSPKLLHMDHTNTTVRPSPVSQSNASTARRRDLLFSLSNAPTNKSATNNKKPTQPDNGNVTNARSYPWNRANMRPPSLRVFSNRKRRRHATRGFETRQIIPFI